MVDGKEVDMVVKGYPEEEVMVVGWLVEEVVNGPEEEVTVVDGSEVEGVVMDCLETEVLVVVVVVDCPVEEAEGSPSSGSGGTIHVELLGVPQVYAIK